MPRQQQAVKPVGPSIGLPAEFRCVPHEWGVGAVRLHASGELDLASVPRLTEALQGAFTSARLVLLDLSELTFIETVGVHVIVGATTRALSTGNRLVLVRAPACVTRVFALTRTADAIEILDVGDVDTLQTSAG